MDATDVFGNQVEGWACTSFPTPPRGMPPPPPLQVMSHGAPPTPSPAGHVPALPTLPRPQLRPAHDVHHPPGHGPAAMVGRPGGGGRVGGSYLCGEVIPLHGRAGRRGGRGGHTFACASSFTTVLPSHVLPSMLLRTCISMFLHTCTSMFLRTCT